MSYFYDMMGPTQEEHGRKGVSHQLAKSSSSRWPNLSHWITGWKGILLETRYTSIKNLGDQVLCSSSNVKKSFLETCSHAKADSRLITTTLLLLFWLYLGCRPQGTEVWLCRSLYKNLQNRWKKDETAWTSQICICIILVFSYSRELKEILT